MAAVERCVQLARGLSALTAILALAAGLPYGLWRTIGWPLPSRIPTIPELQAWLLAPLSDHVLLNILAIAC